jgi:hypothetical protein
MKEKIFDIIVKIESVCPNDFEFGNMVRKAIIISNKGEDEIDVEKLVESIRGNNKNIKI